MRNEYLPAFKTGGHYKTCRKQGKTVFEAAALSRSRGAFPANRVFRDGAGIVTFWDRPFQQGLFTRSA
jgi:hypothetical protein